MRFHTGPEEDDHEDEIGYNPNRALSVPLPSSGPERPPSTWERWPVARRAEAVLAYMRARAIPLFTCIGANGLWLLGAEASSVIEAILWLHDHGHQEVMAWARRTTEHSVKETALLNTEGLATWLDSRREHI
jgi:hypothetical protein